MYQMFASDSNTTDTAIEKESYYFSREACCGYVFVTLKSKNTYIIIMLITCIIFNYKVSCASMRLWHSVGINIA